MVLDGYSIVRLLAPRAGAAPFSVYALPSALLALLRTWFAVRGVILAYTHVVATSTYTSLPPALGAGAPPPPTLSP